MELIFKNPHRGFLFYIVFDIIIFVIEEVDFMAKRKKPYNYNTSRRNNNRNKEKVNLENTVRIRIDDVRLNDEDSLDTSFLEGRIKKNKKIKKKINIDTKKLKFFLWGTLFSFIFIMLIISIVNGFFIKTKSNKTDKMLEKVNIKIDNNYLFVGDYSINRINFDNYDYHYVKSSDDDMTTIDLVNNLHDRIYKYNPSHIFICIGSNDLNDDKSIEEIIGNISKIISGIKNNRGIAKIYIMSLYPINKDADNYDDNILNDNINNKKIIELNNKIKDLCKSKNVNYIDIFSSLEDKNNLNKDYTDNGIYLNEKGNNIVMNRVKKILGN